MTAGSGKSASRTGLVKKPDAGTGTEAVASPPVRSSGGSPGPSESRIHRTYCRRDRCQSDIVVSRRRGRGLLRPAEPVAVIQPPEGRKRLADDLVHIVVAVGGEAADERHSGRF